MTKTPIIDAETGTQEAQIATSSNFYLDSNLTPEGMANAIRADVATFERHSRLAAFVAIRIGLRLLWIRDNGQHGDIGKFIAAHLQSLSRASLTKYMNVAETFANEAGLVNKKTHLLTNSEAIAPILNEQLELFADPQANLEGALKKVMKWVGSRGLSQIYRDIADEPAGKKSLPPTGGGSNPKPPASRRSMDEADAEAGAEATTQYLSSSLPGLLDDGPLTALMRLCRKKADEMEDLLRGRAGRSKRRH